MPVIDVRLAQLYAFRSQIEALRTQIDALVALEEVAIQAVREAVGCEHPEDRRVPAETFGFPRRFKCLNCGDLVDGIA
jgi:hypothetical protein